ncbi:hypothetical protein GQ600_19430 [Phytophthora cactorum]|nr:hypothetical protein GQ600_19430 [Phytophthora cactorum]
MPQQYHHTIALIYAALSTIHGVCVLLMLGSSIWMCSLTFSPWSSRKAGTSSDEAQPNPRLTFLVKIYNKFTYPCGLFGVRGNYFELALVCREIVETTLQTIQVYRMSALLPRTLLNRFYSILLGVNRWSSVIIDTVFTKRDEARRRFASVFFDCLLDLMATMGVESYCDHPRNRDQIAQAVTNVVAIHSAQFKDRLERAGPLSSILITPSSCDSKYFPGAITCYHAGATLHSRRSNSDREEKAAE